MQSAIMSNVRTDPDRDIIIKRKNPSKLELAANPNTHYYAGFRIDKLVVHIYTILNGVLTQNTGDK